MKGKELIKKAKKYGKAVEACILHYLKYYVRYLSEEVKIKNKKKLILVFTTFYTNYYTFEDYVLIFFHINTI